MTFATLIVLGLGVILLLDHNVWVATDNAQITGAVVQLGSPTNGQLRSVLVEVGDEVSRGQVVATVALASPQNSPQAPVTQASVRATADGVVAARHGQPGDAVTAGRPILSVVDPNSLAVQANVDEGFVGRVRAGLIAEVTVPGLGRTFAGRVSGVGPASTTATAQLGQTTGTGVSRPGVQTIPVRIDVDFGNTPPALGSSATVRIRVQE